MERRELRVAERSGGGGRGGAARCRDEQGKVLCDPISPDESPERWGEVTHTSGFVINYYLTVLIYYTVVVISRMSGSIINL